MKYKALKPGETIQSGDQYQSIIDYPGKWMPTGNAGGVVRGNPDSLKYRRPVNERAKLKPRKPAQQFRALKAGTILKPGDLWFCKLSKRWKRTTSAGSPAPSYNTYKRPIAPSKKSKNSKPAARRKAK